ncbi:secretion protein, partial [Candidatus Falkowbacteria bacterium CG10_big_fil_rev_8_21_14_0_10_39_9]
MKKLFLLILFSGLYLFHLEVIEAQTPNIEWQECLGDTGSDVAITIIQTSDGGYAIAGSTKSINGNVSGNHGEADYWVVKINSSGDLLWQKCYGGTSTEILNSIKNISDGYIIVGYSGSNDGDVSNNHGLYDYWVVKIN